VTDSQVRQRQDDDLGSGVKSVRNPLDSERAAAGYYLRHNVSPPKHDVIAYRHNVEVYRDNVIEYRDNVMLSDDNVMAYRRNIWYLTIQRSACVCVCLCVCLHAGGEMPLKCTRRGADRSKGS